MSKRIIITGASSGIGEALAHELANQGHHLALCARRADELEALCSSLKEQHPNGQFYWQTLDVTQFDQVAGCIQNLTEQLGGLDILVANAGVIGVRRTGSGELEKDQTIFNVNLMGAIATVDAAVAIFKEQGHGQIVGISSFSAFIGIPGSAAYSASKAGFSNYLQAVRTELCNRNIQITCIHPGFIQTALSPDMDKYPFVIKADKAAQKMAHAIHKKKKDVSVPAWPWAILKHLLPLLPDSALKKVF
ncbi:MAG TPA: SDR family NAD(P)-dependent oxidoreductase [Pseudomonadales bacterium]|nr:SDR family NAD(P)-dependent oxidoreductase [Pseudomonadales bacterium]